MTAAARIGITGSIVALVTPMHADGALDAPALARLIDWHVAEGTEGIVIAGTTGESATIAVDEHCRLIADAVRIAAGRIPIIAGCGANSTREAIELTQAARDAGAIAGLSVVPYYNKPTQEGLYRHFRQIAESVDLPLILYNVPGRTVADLANDTVLRLAQIPRIVGIKDATGDLARGAELLIGAPADFVVYSGDDPTAAPYLLLGARGVISVTANLAPRLMHALCAASLARRTAEAVALHFRLMPLHRAVLMEPNPIPAKWALAAMGRMEGGIRLPLVPLSGSLQPRMRDALVAAGIKL